MIDFVKALKRPFSDTKNFLIGAILGIIPILNFTVIGYILDSTDLKKEEGKRDSLPEWTNYGALFTKGLVAVVIILILFLPAVLVLLGTVGTVVISPALSLIFGGVSMETWDSLMAGQITDMQIQDWFAQNWTQFIPLFTNAVPFLLIGAALAALAYYIMPAAILGWLKEDRFSAAFSMKVLKTTASLDYLVNWLIVGFLGGIVSSLLGWIPFLGMGITMYARGIFSYTVFAELYERA